MPECRAWHGSGECEPCNGTGRVDGFFLTRCATPAAVLAAATTAAVPVPVGEPGLRMI